MIANRAGVSADDVRHYEWLERQYPSTVAMNVSHGEMGVEFFKTRTRERAMGILPPKLYRRRSSEIQLDTIRQGADRLSAALQDLLNKGCPSDPYRNAEPAITSLSLLRENAERVLTMLRS